MENIQPENEAYLDSCNHLFCYECIYSWAVERKNECPLCKLKFNHITH